MKSHLFAKIFSSSVRQILSRSCAGTALPAQRTRKFACCWLSERASERVEREGNQPQQQMIAILFCSLQPAVAHMHGRHRQEIIGEEVILEKKVFKLS